MKGGETAQLLEAVVWGGVLIGGVAVLATAFWLVRRWVKSSKEPGRGEAVWSLQHLRELRASGQLTEAEFEKLRSGVLAAMGGAGEGSPGVEPGRKGGAGAASGGPAAQSSPRPGNEIKRVSEGGR